MWDIFGKVGYSMELGIHNFSFIMKPITRVQFFFVAILDVWDFDVSFDLLKEKIGT
jgi:hypothetical protein